jgi:5-oxoprolinase (ATP-hydrolysing) subunit C
MIKILKPGVQLTIQDFGRVGYRHLGISTAGSLDPYAQCIANRMLGNHDNDAVLEVTVGLCELQFNCDTAIALQGADLHAQLDNQPIYPGWCYRVKKDQVLSFATGKAGLRAYVAVKGGVQCPQVLGSRATDLNSGFGGLHGQALKVDDEISIKAFHGPVTKAGAFAPAKRHVIRVHPSPHAQWLGESLLNTFVTGKFKVSPNSNRMGVRLTDKTVNLAHSVSLPSVAVSPGSIQLPPNGEPIVILNDGQTTGGYPLLGTVIEADRHQFAQFKPGDHIQFKYVSLHEAHTAQQNLDAHLYKLNIGLNKH